MSLTFLSQNYRGVDRRFHIGESSLALILRQNGSAIKDEYTKIFRKTEPCQFTQSQAKKIGYGVRYGLNKLGWQYSNIQSTEAMYPVNYSHFSEWLINSGGVKVK